jgi:hypothetical protein
MPMQVKYLAAILYFFNLLPSLTGAKATFMYISLCSAFMIFNSKQYISYIYTNKYAHL